MSFDNNNPKTIGGKGIQGGFPANLQSIRFNLATNQWEFITVTGELNTMTNVGAGPGFIFRNKIGVNFNIKSLINGTNMTILNNVDDITISTLAEINLGASVGAGTGIIFRDKTGVTLNIKSLIAGTGITLVNGADDITITSSVAAGLGDLEFLRDKELSGDLLLSYVIRSAIGVAASIIPAAGKTFFVVSAQIGTNGGGSTACNAELRNDGTIIDGMAVVYDTGLALIDRQGKSIVQGDSLVGDGVRAFDINLIVISVALPIFTVLEGWIQDT